MLTKGSLRNTVTLDRVCANAYDLSCLCMPLSVGALQVLSTQNTSIVSNSSWHHTIDSCCIPGLQIQLAITMKLKSDMAGHRCLCSTCVVYWAALMPKSLHASSALPCKHASRACRTTAPSSGCPSHTRLNQLNTACSQNPSRSQHHKCQQLLCHTQLQSRRHGHSPHSHCCSLAGLTAAP